MSLPGTGVVPAATSPLNAELASLTRRAFIPRIVVQIYYATPMLFMLLGSAQRAACDEQQSRQRPITRDRDIGLAEERSGDQQKADGEPDAQAAADR